MRVRLRRLERRQVLEATHPEAFASAEMVERVLVEVGTGKYRGGKGNNLLGELRDIEIAFPSMGSLSHMSAAAHRTRGRALRRLAAAPRVRTSRCLGVAGGSIRRTPTRTAATCARCGCPLSSGSSRSG